MCVGVWLKLGAEPGARLQGDSPLLKLDLLLIEEGTDGLLQRSVRVLQGDQDGLRETGRVHSLVLIVAHNNGRYDYTVHLQYWTNSPIPIPHATERN